MTIIAPSSRVINLIEIKKKWLYWWVDNDGLIIVYDGNKIESTPYISQVNEIKEYLSKGEGISGNPQRNCALTQSKNPNTLLYY